jgi:hypothetical protein
MAGLINLIKMKRVTQRARNRKTIDRKRTGSHTGCTNKSKTIPTKKGNARKKERYTVDSQGNWLKE